MLAIMVTRVLFACIAIAAALVCGTYRAAGLYKCVDANGRVSYQDTPCKPGTTSLPIDRRFANSLGLTVSPADKALVKRFDKTRLHQHQARLRRIERRLQSWRLKDDECNSLKKRWYHYLDTHHLARNANPSLKAELIRQMREACSN